MRISNKIMGLKGLNVLSDPCPSALLLTKLFQDLKDA